MAMIESRPGDEEASAGERWPGPTRSRRCSAGRCALATRPSSRTGPTASSAPPPAGPATSAPRCCTSRAVPVPPGVQVHRPRPVPGLGRVRGAQPLAGPAEHLTEDADRQLQQTYPAWRPGSTCRARTTPGGRRLAGRCGWSPWSPSTAACRLQWGPAPPGRGPPPAGQVGAVSPGPAQPQRPSWSCPGSPGSRGPGCRAARGPDGPRPVVSRSRSAG